MNESRIECTETEIKSSVALSQNHADYVPHLVQHAYGIAFIIIACEKKRKQILHVALRVSAYANHERITMVQLKAETLVENALHYTERIFILVMTIYKFNDIRGVIPVKAYTRLEAERTKCMVTRLPLIAFARECSLPTPLFPNSHKWLGLEDTHPALEKGSCRRSKRSIGYKRAA